MDPSHSSLFLTSIQKLIHECSEEKAFDIAWTILTEINKRKRTVTIVINKCYGGFGLSEEARTILETLGPIELDPPEEIEEIMMDYCYHRNHPYLVSVVRALGPHANVGVSKLKIVTKELGLGEDFDISEYDGQEGVRTIQRTPSSVLRYKVKPQEEIDRIIQEEIRKLDLVLDPDEMARWRDDHDN
jgi:hypothetical protein